jgi:xanthosine utilization system XapX-like protein
MKLTVRALVVIALCMTIIPAALAKKRPAPPAVSIAGVYGGDFTVGEGSGDLEGMRVIIVNAGNAYHAIVQIAQGGAEDPQPQFVPVSVKGMKVNFAVGEQKFAGTVSAKALTLKDADGQTETLKRKPCSSFF